MAQQRRRRRNPDERMRELQRRAALGDRAAQEELEALEQRSGLKSPEWYAYQNWLRWTKKLRQKITPYTCEHAGRDRKAAGQWAEYACEHTEDFPRDFFWSFTDFGGYPLVYVTKRNEELCADCVNDTDNADPDSGSSDDPPVDAYVHYEGPPEFCSGCNEEIESAYGDPDAEDEDAD